MFLKRAHPTMFIFYKAVFVVMFGVGITSALANPSAESPPILKSFFNFIPINIWGYLYILISIILFVGLFIPKVTRLGLKLSGGALLIRLLFQLWEGFFIAQEIGWQSWREWLPTVSGLPILLGLSWIVQGMLQEPFSNPDSSPDINVLRIPNGDDDS